MAGYDVFALMENWDSVINVVIDMHKKCNYKYFFNQQNTSIWFLFSIEHLTLGVNFRKTESSEKCESRKKRCSIFWLMT